MRTERHRDNIMWIAWNMAWERRLERKARAGFRQWPDRYSALIPIIEGDVELEFSNLGRCDTLENVSEDRGIYEEINDPQIFGYYRYKDDGPYMTLEQCAAYIGPEPSFDHERHVMKPMEHYDFGRPVRIDFNCWTYK